MSHYNNHKLENLDHLKRIFPSGKADDLNWCVLSTSGVHGTYITLDQIESWHEDPIKFEKEENDGETFSPYLTVLVIMPRMVSMIYGNIYVDKEDIPYLRKLVSSSLEAIAATQRENVVKEGN